MNDSDLITQLKPDNTLEIPFRDILHLNQLASIRIEYQLNEKDKRYNYLTENKTVNIRKSDIPNIISVEFVDNPQKEMVYRTIKGLLRKGALVIFSSSKTQTKIPDSYDNIEFEDSYPLRKETF